jgi:type IV fimbrial biogenesis protein FimT
MRTMRGFTLIELILSLAVAAVLLGMAIPALHGTLRRSRSRTTANALANALRTTRMLAISHNQRALLCPSHDGRHCSGDALWRNGWIVGVDRMRDGQPDDTPAMTWPALPASLRVVGSRGRRRVYFQPNGRSPGSNLSLLVCPVHPQDSRILRVVVSNVGRVRIDRVAASRCN